jgi:hypothetical protein
VIKIHNTREMPPKPLHCFVYGPPRTGKTSLAASFPKPIFLSVGTEGGDATLRFYDVHSILIRSKQDMKEAVDYIRAGAKNYGWRTVVIDSVTFYSDLIVQEITGGGERPMRQPDWGILDLHLQKWLLPSLHELPLHVVWIALEQALRGKDGEVRGIEPMLYGKTAAKLPAACDLIVRTDVIQQRVDGNIQNAYVMRTVPHDGAAAGGRFGPAFAEGVLPAHFAIIAQRIGPVIGEALGQSPHGEEAA